MSSIEVELLDLFIPTKATGRTYLVTPALLFWIEKMYSNGVTVEWQSPSRPETMGAEDWIKRIRTIDLSSGAGLLSGFRLKTVDGVVKLTGLFTPCGPHGDFGSKILRDNSAMFSMRAFSSKISTNGRPTWWIDEVITFDLSPLPSPKDDSSNGVVDKA